jgi:4-amino-4-deoxy-L-arabinose transferase-like glycosyltransferase
MPQDLSQLRQDRRITVGIFFLALAVYLFTFVGAPKSPDERALFSGIDSLIKRGDFKVNQIYWDYSNVAMETTDGEMVPNYEPAQMILAIPFYLWGRSLDAALQGVMVFNAVVTAASVALLYLCFIELGYRRRTATLGALVYAFATLAWPYSRVFFREPLTVLAYLLAVYALLRYRAPAPRRLLWPALAGAAAGLAFVTKQISVAAFPSLLLLAFAYEWRRPADAGPDRSLWQTRLRVLLAAAVPLAVIVLLGQVYQWTTLGGVETFARNIVEYTTNPQLSSSLPERMLRGGLGLTVSPFRGIFWYSPVLLLGLVGAVSFTRRHRWEGIAFLLLIAAHILGYSRYLYWSGGVAWGARYMLPIIPFLLLLAAPVFAWLIKDQAPASTSDLSQSTGSGFRVTHYALRITTWLLIAWSSVVAFLGILFDWRAYELPFLLEQAKVWGGIGEAIDAYYMNPATSPVVGHIRLLLEGGAPLDFAWMQQRAMGESALVPQGLLLSLGLVGLALAALVWIWRRPERAGLAAAGMSAASLVVASLLLVTYRQGDARFDAYDVDRFLQPIMARLEEVPCGWQGCDQVALMPDPALTDYFLNRLAAPLVWYGIDYAPVNERLMERLAGRYGRIWLVRDRSAAADDAEGRRAVERWLVEHAYKLDEQQIDNWARLVQFSAAGRAAEIVEPGQTLGDMSLARAWLGVEQQRSTGRQTNAEPLDDGQVFARPGDVLQLSLRWRAEQPPEGNYTVFVQLLDGNGQVVAQRDRWPGDGLFPTAALQAGQVISDNLAIALDVPPGRYRLIAGLYRGDVEGYPRLSGPGGDFVELPAIQVQP